MFSKGAVILLKGYLGDAVLATPLLAEAARFYEPIWVVTEPAVIEILEGTFPTHTFLRSRKLSKPVEFLRQASELRALSPEVALVVNRSFRSAFVARVAGIRERVGHATEGRAWLLTGALPYEADRPETECYLDLLRELGHKAGSPPPRLEVAHDSLERARERLDGATIGVQPGARYAGKQWPVSHLAELVDQLAARGHRIAMLGGKDEVEAAAELQGKVARPMVNLVGHCTLKEVMGVLKALRLTIGSDTGLMHIAAGVGCPTVTIFGPNPASKWAHREPPHRAIQAPGEDMAAVSSIEVYDACLEAFPDL